MNFFQFLDLVKARWKADSPTFFIKWQNFGISLIATGTSMVGVSAINGITLPLIISKVGVGFIIAGTCIGFVSKLTVQNPAGLDTSMSKPPETTVTQSGTAAGNVVTKQ